MRHGHVSLKLSAQPTQPMNSSVPPANSASKSFSHMAVIVTIICLSIFLGIGVLILTKKDDKQTIQILPILSPKILQSSPTRLETVTPITTGLPNNIHTSVQTTESTQNSNDLVNQKIAACRTTGEAQYVKDGDTQTIWSTTREYLRLPNDIYPFSKLSTTDNNATMDYISNGGPLPPIVENNCWAVYYEFDLTQGDTGSVDINIPSAKKDFPNFHAHITVTAH